MIDQQQLAQLYDERHGDPPDPIPNTDERRVLSAVSRGEVQVSSGGIPAVRGLRFATLPRTAFRACLARGWIHRADEAVTITDAGTAALARHRASRPQRST